MKSLNSLESKYLTPEVLAHIASEGFVMHNNDSYCCHETGTEWSNRCYYLYYDKCKSLSIGIYIFDEFIGVDVDYDCGGNLNTYFWKFDTYTFEEAYDLMVDKVQEYI